MIKCQTIYFLRISIFVRVSVFVGGISMRNIEKKYFLQRVKPSLLKNYFDMCARKRDKALHSLLTS